ncbi:ammonium transporter [Sphingobium sp. AN641]|uniref:ammonium transporter n=1 Tax=Sphingobium sp. AN641 TaxID=3133443 RepID=UPI0030C32E60
MRHILSLAAATLFLVVPQGAQAQVAVADSGDTGWMLACTMLVLVAAIPGLMFRHAGLVGVRNALSVMAQGAAVAAAVSIAWGAIGYSLAYAPGSAWLGGAGNALLANLGTLRDGLTVPESAFALFQMSLAIFAAALIPGALAERTRVGWMLAFAPLWMLVVYAPVARWTWGGGWLAEMGVLDYAGALVVHITAGFSALALALIVGPRREPGEGHSPLLTLAGSALVWIGWMGISGGWALGATDDAASALLNTHFAACTAALCWALLDRLATGRVSATGIMSGALSGLAAISASAGLVGAGGAMMIGLIAAAVSRFAFALLRGGKADDAAAIFAIHGIGGLAGMILLVPFTLPLLGGVGLDPSLGVMTLALMQLAGVGVVALWATIGAAILGIGLSLLVPMRVSEADEDIGLDASAHDQQSWLFR